MAVDTGDQPHNVEKLKFKDWATLLMSALALIISGGTGYFNFLRIADDLSLVVNNTTGAPRDKNKLIVSGQGNIDFIFINSGSRPAVIEWLQLFYLQFDEKDVRKCADYLYGNETIFQTDFEPTVVKEKEVAVKKVKIVGAKSPKITKEPNGTFTFPVDDVLTGKDEFTVMLCATVRVATASVAIHDIAVSLFEYKATRGDILYDEVMETNTAWLTPQILIKNTAIIFDK